MKYKVRARMVVYSRLTNTALTPEEEYSLLVDTTESIRNLPSTALQLWMDSKLKEAYTTHFVGRLRTDLKLKRKIGNTKWVIQARGISFKPFFQAE